MTHYLVIEDGRIVCHLRYMEPVEKAVFQNYDELIEFCKQELVKLKCQPKDLVVLSSSTLDWPEDFTDHKPTIEACRKFRGG